MEGGEVLQLVQGIPVATTVLSRSPLHWSHDNNLAVVTQHGAYVLELIISPEESSPAVLFTRCFIPNPEKPNAHNDTGIDIKAVVHSAERSTGHSFMLNDVLSSGQRAMVEMDPRLTRNPAPGMPGGEPVHRGYIRAAWSPLGVGEHGRCLLTLVTSDHRVSLLGRTGRHWSVLADLSAQWHQYNVSNSWQDTGLPPNAQQHELFTARMGLLAIAYLKWTPMYEDEDGKYTVLMGTSADGYVVFWRAVPTVSSIDQLSIIGVKNTIMSRVSVIYWHNIANATGYLLVGNNAGCLKILYCQLKKNDIVLIDLGYVWDEEDELCVSHVALQQVFEEKFVLVFSKHTFLMASTLTLTHHSLHQHHTVDCHVGSLEVSGLTVLEDWHAVVSVKDGNIKTFMVNVTEDWQVSLVPLVSDFHSDLFSNIALTHSYNKTLLGFLETIRVPYDHLIERDPSLVNIYRVGDTDELLTQLLHSVGPLHHNTDILESLRVALCKTGKFPVVMVEASIIPSLPLPQLKVYYWLAKMARSNNLVPQDQQLHLNEIEPALQNAIVEHWTTEKVQEYSQRDLPQQPLLLLSLQLMCQWLQTHATDTSITTTTKELIKKLGKLEGEACPVCREVVQLDSLTFGRCHRGHCLPRCSLTLLLTEPTIQCPRCRVYAHQEAKNLGKEKWLSCIFCDGYMVEEFVGQSEPHPEVNRCTNMSPFFKPKPSKRKRKRKQLAE